MNWPPRQNWISGRAPGRIGLRYAFNEKATLMLDYTYQSDETTEEYIESPKDV